MSPASACPTTASGTCAATTSTDRAGRAAGRSRATKTSGKVTENPIATTIHGAKSATRRPSSVPDVPRCSPRRAPQATIGSPATANTPAVAPTATSASHERRDDVVGDAVPVEPEPRERHRGDEAERRRGDRHDRRAREVRVPEARDRADALARGERQADEVGRLQRRAAAPSRARRVAIRSPSVVRSAAGRPSPASPRAAPGAPSATTGIATASSALSAIPRATATTPVGVDPHAG